jgi:hypothetical protein
VAVYAGLTSPSPASPFTVTAPALETTPSASARTAWNLPTHRTPCPTSAHGATNSAPAQALRARTVSGLDAIDLAHSPPSRSSSFAGTQAAFAPAFAVVARRATSAHDASGLALGQAMRVRNVSGLDAIAVTHAIAGPQSPAGLHATGRENLDQQAMRVRNVSGLDAVGPAQ